MGIDVFHIGQGDTLPILERQFLDDAGAAIDLTGATVRFVMADPLGVNVIDVAGLTPEAPETEGRVRYPWADGDAALAGPYEAKFIATWPGANPTPTETAPNNGFLLIAVDPRPTLGA
jgi:hypothetical protein